ncbi:unnamed protein product [Discula destructiva]
MHSIARGLALASSGAGMAGADPAQAATDANVTAATTAISDALKFATSKTIRTSTVILASFNAFAAFITALGIIHGCRAYNKRMQKRASDAPPSGLFYIHTVEVFPFVLCLGITVQSITFAAAQSLGLQALLSSACTLPAIFLLPAIFVVPLTHLVFGLETAFRGVRSDFAPRGRWNVSICLACVGLMCVAAVVVGAFNRAPQLCFANLFFFLKHYSTGCFAVFSLVSLTTLLVIATIFLKLRKGQFVSATERLAATRMIFYLVLGFISEVFVLPFFFSMTFLKQQNILYERLDFAMVAAVVSNVNGLMVAGLYLFLRSQNNQVLQDWNKDERKEDKFGSRDQHRSSSHSLQPVKRSSSRPRSDSQATLLHADDGEETRGFLSPMSYGTARTSFSPRISIPSNPTYPEPTQPPSETSPSQLRRQSYSLFPQNCSTAAAAVLPATAYSPMTSKPARSTWEPPPVVMPWIGRGHKRDSSLESSATVQIGIRFSHVGNYVPRASSDTDVPDVVLVPQVQPTPTLRPSPLADVETRSDSSNNSHAATSIVKATQCHQASIKDVKMKTLPPVPRSPAISVTTACAAADSNAVSPVTDDGEAEEQEGPLIILSPTVYRDPVELQTSASDMSSRKLPSPMGVGFNTPTGRGPSDPRLAALAPPRPTGSAATTPLPSTKTDWI